MSQQRNTAYRGKTIGYIDGNTVRKYHQPSHQQRSEETHREYVERRRAEREQRERQKKLRAAARRNQERALVISPGYVAFLLGAMTVMGLVFGSYLRLQAEMTGRVKSVAALESQALDLKTENDAREKQIETSVNLADIREKAIRELGMVYPSEGQIEYFQIDSSDYMNQYEEIPED